MSDPMSFGSIWDLLEVNHTYWFIHDDNLKDRIEEKT